MGKLKCFEIIFDENRTVYHPGELVKGQCIVELKGDMKMRALRIFMRGVAKVHWTESRSTGTRLGNYTEHYNAEVEYFLKKQVLYGGEQSDVREVLLEGRRHEFSFSFELPIEGISTSFEGKHGSVRYWLKAEMDKPWSFNHKTKKAFTVISPIDINKPEYQLPVENSVEKTLCCWLCTSGPICINARTDRRGYCPGESIAISADFENYSSRTIIPYATLHQTQTFFANGKSRVRSTKFTVLTGLPVSPGNRATWDAQLLKIPAVSPSIMNCHVIKVDYYVKVALHIPGAYNLALHLPIVIGTVPFRRLATYLTDTRMLQEALFASNLVVPSPPPYRESPTPPPPIDFQIDESRTGHSEVLIDRPVRPTPRRSPRQRRNTTVSEIDMSDQPDIWNLSGTAVQEQEALDENEGNSHHQQASVPRSDRSNLIDQTRQARERARHIPKTTPIQEDATLDDASIDNNNDTHNTVEQNASEQDAASQIENPENGFTSEVESHSGVETQSGMEPLAPGVQIPGMVIRPRELRLGSLPDTFPDVVYRPPTYAETISGAVNLYDDDDDEDHRGAMGELTFTPMYTYVYDYRYRAPPAYTEMDPHPRARSASSRL